MWKRILRKIFVLPPVLTILIAIPSFVLVFIVLARNEHSVLAYVSYILSAYSLIISVTGGQQVIQAIQKKGKNLPLIHRIREHPMGSRLFGDAVFRSEITLHGGFVINLLYVALNLWFGIWYRSAWFSSLAIYYSLLSIMRAVLVRYVHKKPLGEDLRAELTRYRACGIILVLMNQALMGIVMYMVYQNQGFTYAGTLIYAMAAYTFYITIVAIINVVRYRKYGSPILSAAKVVSLTSALVSMLSLETAMLSQFGRHQEEFRRMMLSISGGGVCVIVLGMAIGMIVQSTRQIKKISNRE